MQYPFNIEWGLFSKKFFPVPVICTDLVSCALMFFYFILKLLIWLAGSLAVIMFLWAGIMLIVNPEKRKDVKNILIWGSLGLALALLSWVIVKAIENTIATGDLGGFLMNFTYAQQLQFTPGRLSCTGINIFDVLGGRGVPSGIFGKCLLWLATKILTVIYTVSLLLAIGFIIYGGIILYTKPGDKSGWNYILWAIIGSIVTISAFSIVKAIEYSLTH